MKKSASYSLFISYIMAFIAVFLMASHSAEVKQQQQNCPSERLLVKTLTDSSADKISFNATRSDVQELRKIQVPEKITPNMPRTGKEFNTYQINCYVKSYTLTETGDYRLTIQGFDDTTATAIAQIINPTCEQAKNSKYIQEFQSAHETFSQYALLNNKASKGVYKIIGVLLFEGSVRKDGISVIVPTIHPVTYISKFK